MNTELYKELESFLITSTAAQRKNWAGAIAENNIPLKDLVGLLEGDKKLATRFLWFLSEVGLLHPKTLLQELPFLWTFCQKLNPAYRTSFANYWRFVGVPEENEGIATEVLFQWLLSPEINSTIKARAFLVLFELTKKYPELKNELKLALEDQRDKFSPGFKKRAEKVLAKLEV